MAPGYTLSSSAHGTFSRIDHMLGQKKSLNKFKIDFISSICLEHNDMKLEIKNRIEIRKITNICKLNNILLNNQWVKKGIKKYSEIYKNGNTT